MRRLLSAIQGERNVSKSFILNRLKESKFFHLIFTIKITNSMIHDLQ